MQERTESIDTVSGEPTVTKKRKLRIETKECGTQTLDTKVSRKLDKIHKKLQKIISKMLT